MKPPVQLIEIEEYEPKALPRSSLSVELGTRLWQTYRSRLQVEFPGPPTDNQWRLTSLGWIGYIPLSEEMLVAINPKVDISNVFRMLEYAYRLKSFDLLDGSYKASTLAELYEQIALLLAERVLDRERKGFYRAYVLETTELSYLRGRLEIRERMSKPWNTRLTCHFEEFTEDIEDNQILAWTLNTISRSGLCTDRTAPTIRRAYRHLSGLVSPMPKAARDCIGRRYHRLNQDYHPLHALCRFFLENSGPTHHLGNRDMLPFLIDMARLYELFVAEWLEANLPSKFALRTQEVYELSRVGNLDFRIDLVLYDSYSQRSLAVLDTKYKRKPYPSTEDIQQVVTYATAKHYNEAILVFPTSEIQPFERYIGDIHVQSLAFPIGGDLEEAGRTFFTLLLRLING